MKQVEIRVRPVVRHVVTRFTEERTSAPGEAPAYTRHLETLGEFDNEAQAEAVAEALRGQAPKPMQYVCVERGFECVTNAMYFDCEQDADEFIRLAREQDRDFRKYSREVTDPVHKARLEVEGGLRVPGFHIPPPVPQETGMPQLARLEIRSQRPD